MSREAGNYHVIQGGTWKVAKWEPSRFGSPIDGHWHIAGYRRSFLDGELDQIGPRILPPDLDDDLPRRYELQRAEYKLARERLMILANEALELEAKLKALFALMDEADDALDKDTYEQKRKDEFDTPDDAEWWIRAGTERKCAKVFAEIDRLRKSMGGSCVS